MYVWKNNVSVDCGYVAYLTYTTSIRYQIPTSSLNNCKISSVSVCHRRDNETEEQRQFIIKHSASMFIHCDWIKRNRDIIDRN